MATSARVRNEQEKGLYTALLREFSKVEISRVKISKISNPELGAGICGNFAHGNW